MLFRRTVLDQMAGGRITLAFRRWRRPTVKARGSLKTAVGLLAIEALDRIREDQITEEEARGAGYGSRRELLNELKDLSRGARSMILRWRNDIGPGPSRPGRRRAAVRARRGYSVRLESGHD